MQLSANLPSGSNTAQNYIVRRADTRLPNNVRPEADASYKSEKGLRSGNERMEGWPVGTCSRGSEAIYNATFLSQREEGQFCSKECRTGRQPERRGGRPRKFKCNAEKQQAYRRRALLG